MMGSVVNNRSCGGLLNILGELSQHPYGVLDKVAHVVARLQNGDEHADDDRAVGELRTDHPLDEVKLKLVYVFAEGSFKLLKIALGCQPRGI